MKDKSQTKPKQTKRGSNGKANTSNTTHDSQARKSLHSLPLWHRDAKKAERTPTHKGWLKQRNHPNAPVRLGSRDVLLDVLARIRPLEALLRHPFGLRGDDLLRITRHVLSKDLHNL